MAITSAQHPLIKHLVKLRQEASYRKETKSLVLIGDKLIQELTLPIRTLLYTTSHTPQIPAQEKIPITDSLLKKISGLVAPETLAAEIAMPPQEGLKNASWILALDGISDPGNLGTLLRTACALGWQGAWIGPKSADPYNDKALRAAKGATFHLPWQQTDSLDTLIQERPFSIYIADKEGTPLKECAPTPPLILIMGSESHGASPLLKARYPSICIPMPGPIESLNVAAAGAILMHALK